MCSKTISVCEQLKEHLRKSKIEQISNTCCSIFNATIRKESYISNIVIDDNFNLKLYSDGKEITKDTTKGCKKWNMHYIQLYFIGVELPKKINKIFCHQKWEKPIFPL